MAGETIPAGRRPGPGRPPSGARERILAAAFAILTAEGYAGLTMAKVAAEAGENRALIGYHFGGKQGLVAEVARGVAAVINGEILAAIEGVGAVEDLAEAAVAATWRVMDRDEGYQRIYFDLASQSVVDPEIEAIMSAVKSSFREVLRGRIRELTGLEDPAAIEGAAVYLIAGVEGLALERLDRGETPELAAARRIWVRSVAAVLAPG